MGGPRPPHIQRDDTDRNRGSWSPEAAAESAPRSCGAWPPRAPPSPERRHERRDHCRDVGVHLAELRVGPPLEAPFVLCAGTATPAPLPHATQRPHAPRDDHARWANAGSAGKLRCIRYYAVLQRISALGCLPITCAYRYCAPRATIFRFGPPLSTYVAVDSPDESAQCGQGSMIGKVLRRGSAVAPLPRRVPMPTATTPAAGIRR
jgi:hypothetical protein